MFTCRHAVTVSPITPNQKQGVRCVLKAIIYRYQTRRGFRLGYCSWVNFVSRVMAVGAEFNTVFFIIFSLAISHFPRSGSRDGVSIYGVCHYISSIYGVYV